MTKKQILEVLVGVLRRGDGAATTQRLTEWLEEEHGLRWIEATRLVKQAKAIVAQGISILDRQEEKAAVLQRYEHVYQLALAQSDLVAALRALDGCVALLGLRE